MYMRLWSEPTSREVMVRRAGGRRRINAERKLAVRARREQVECLMACYWDRPDFLASLAAELGVSESTICRDLEALGLRELIRAVRQEERARRKVDSRRPVSRAERRRQAETIAAGVFESLARTGQM